MDWYKDMTFYQIWPRSFCDGNADGIGDLWGVLDKLDYIKSLGVDGIWFSPLYPSPNADYGYDVADYRNIHPDFGNLELFKKVLDGAHERGMKVIMDLVVNHSSDEHPWFLASKDKNSPYRDYYIWREGSPKKRPNNWDSLFEGKAWAWDEQAQAWYLHLFAKKQADLNHDNPAVRQEVKDILRFWLDMGVDGFREDVITFISKPEGLPNDYLMPAAKGIRHYANGPHIHEYLREYRAVTDEYDCITIGEAPQMSAETALGYIREGDKELDMLLNFEHMNADCFMTDYVPLPFSLRKLKRTMSRWQLALRGKAWNTLYIENHDHARIISRYGSEKYRVESGKMLAAMYLLMQGTAFVYQGQEIGMVNMPLERIEDYPDVQSHHGYGMWKSFVGHKLAMKVVHRASRANARTPVQWSAEENAGFGKEPWFRVNPNYKEINVAAQQDDPDSLLNFYRQLLAYRKRPLIRDGSFKEYNKASSKLYVYERALGREKILVVCSFSKKPVKFRPPYSLDGCTKLFGNYEGEAEKLRPYELCVWQVS